MTKLLTAKNAVAIVANGETVRLSLSGDYDANNIKRFWGHASGIDYAPDFIKKAEMITDALKAKSASASL